MKAMAYERYGSPEVLHLKEVQKPVAKSNEILIRVDATTVTSADCRVRSLETPAGFGLMMRLVFGIRRPRQQILGSELGGRIESVGRDVSRFQVGDLVFGFTDAALGCYAEYRCMPEDGAVARIPANLSVEEAVALPFGGTTALHFFRKAKLRSGEKVLINGASGAVGTAAVQLARNLGADVTGVCSTANLELVRSLGAGHVIDYTRDDFTKNGESYDVIVDTAGTAPYSRSKGSLKEGGRLLLVLAGLPAMLPIPWVAMTSSRKIIAAPAFARPDDLRHLADLAEKGELKPIIDRRYRFEQIPEAHRYVDSGRKRGNVVIRWGKGTDALLG